MFSFPKDLASIVSNRWTELVAGEYTPPPCPSTKLLQQLFETSYLAANCPEETRYPKFNIIATPNHIRNPPQGYSALKFDLPRSLNVQEIRRLAPTVDLAKSAIWATWNDDGWSIVGLVDLGTSWHRAKKGLGYRYQAPADLFVQVDRPGRIRVNQGAYHVATLEDGLIIGIHGRELSLFFHPIATVGISSLETTILYPDYESPREFQEFEFIALINTYSAIAAEISSGGHGGMIIIDLEQDGNSQKNLRIKYPCKSAILRNAFISFMNARHVQGDFGAMWDDGHDVPAADMHEAEIQSRDAYEGLVEATRFISALSGCDGAIVLSSDLSLIGFGAEICSEFDRLVSVVEGKLELPRDVKNCDIEQFGMRHRSAINLASQTASYRIIAVSQDGPVSGVYKKDNRVFVDKGISTSNLNLPWA